MSECAECTTNTNLASFLHLRLPYFHNSLLSLRFYNITEHSEIENLLK